MKERIKKFYKEHQDTSDVVLAVAAGFAAFGVVLFTYNKVADSRSVDHVSTDSLEDIQHIFVHLKNGTVKSFTKPDAA